MYVYQSQSMDDYQCTRTTSSLPLSLHMLLPLFSHKDVGGQLGRILGCPRNPPDWLDGCVCGDNSGGSWDVLGILCTAWRAVCEGTLREDAGMSSKT